MTTPTEVRLSLEWELWVVEHLLFTAKRDDLADVLAEQGLPVAVARAQVDAIYRSQAFSRLRARLDEATLAARLQRLQQRLLPPVDGVLVTDDIDRDTLLNQHWVPSRPVKLTQAARCIPAVQQWTIAGLAERFADAAVAVNVQRTGAERPSETEAHVTDVPFPEWIETVLSSQGNEAYVVSRCGLLNQPEFAPLWDDLAPLPAILEPVSAPQGVSLWLGPEGTITPPHFDPHNVLLVQVEGSKRVRLAPRVHAALAGKLDGYYLDGSLDDVMGERVLSVELHAGEALFIPAAWFHEVTSLSPSLTLSFISFPWPNHFHGLGPPGSDDRRRGLATNGRS